MFGDDVHDPALEKRLSDLEAELALERSRVRVLTDALDEMAHKRYKREIDLYRLGGLEERYIHHPRKTILLAMENAICRATDHPMYVELGARLLREAKAKFDRDEEAALLEAVRHQAFLMEAGALPFPKVPDFHNFPLTEWTHE